MKKVFEGNTCLAEGMHDKKRVVYTLNGYANNEDHKNIYPELFGFMKTNPVIAFMHDFKQMKGTFTRLNDWIIEQFRPAMNLD